MLPNNVTKSVQCVMSIMSFIWVQLLTEIFTVCHIFYDIYMSANAHWNFSVQCVTSINIVIMCIYFQIMQIYHMQILLICSWLPLWLWHHEATEKEGNKGIVEKEILRKKCRIKVQLQENGGSSTRQSWMETSDLWPMFHRQRRDISRVSKSSQD